MDPANETGTETEADLAVALRKRSLLFWLSANQEKPKVKVVIPYSKPVSGRFISIDAQEHRVRVDALETPLGTYEHVVLRGGDVDALELSMGKRT